MTQAFIAAIGIMVLLIMSLRANARFRSENRLPMQWSFSGSVNWTAPRPVALAFTPTLATIILVAAVASTLALTPRPGQEGFEVPMIAFIAITFVGVHALHLWLINRSLQRDGN